MKSHRREILIEYTPNAHTGRQVGGNPEGWCGRGPYRPGPAGKRHLDHMTTDRSDPGDTSCFGMLSKSYEHFKVFDFQLRFNVTHVFPQTYLVEIITKITISKILNVRYAFTVIFYEETNSPTLSRDVRLSTAAAAFHDQTYPRSGRTRALCGGRFRARGEGCGRGLDAFQGLRHRAVRRNRFSLIGVDKKENDNARPRDEGGSLRQATLGAGVARKGRRGVYYTRVVTVDDARGRRAGPRGRSTRRLHAGLTRDVSRPRRVEFNSVAFGTGFGYDAVFVRYRLVCGLKRRLAVAQARPSPNYTGVERSSFDPSKPSHAPDLYIVAVGKSAADDILAPALRFCHDSRGGRVALPLIREFVMCRVRYVTSVSLHQLQKHKRISRFAWEQISRAVVTTTVIVQNIYIRPPTNAEHSYAYI
ncbi:hypothetical protein EVAR_59490_1 [Eumeta japonica]|uniref:Uncharacterized protein n=1 Tax=Eumeta variegata TaxID=151549 RepID=A0A4C1YJQ2_EUMVA|nr:hypothetical protein EVAR_59490_1 [Eumeta japonica]